MSWQLWLNDVRFAWRNAARRPGFTALVAATLALGLGVNCAVFALADAVLLRPLPYPDPSRIVFVWQTLPRLNVPEVEATPFDYTAWRGVASFSELAMVAYGSFTLTGAGDPERVRGVRVTASLMPMLGFTPGVGRLFAPQEDLDDAPAVAVLSDGLWRRRYGADPEVVGRTIVVDGEPRMVVGVLRRGADLPASLSGAHDIWLPMRLSAAERISEVSHNYTILGRLAPGVALARASAELNAVAARLAAERPSHAGIGVRLVPIEEQTVRGARPAIVVAIVSVALLLLITIANASTLLVARATNRRHELALRAALGATLAQLRSLAIAESLVYTGLGALSAAVVGSWVLRAAIPLFASSLPATLSIDVDGRAALFTLALAAVVGVSFGAASAHRPAGSIADLVGDSVRTSAAPSAARRRNGLVAVQVSFAVVLLSAAGLMFNSVVKLSRVNPGFDPEHVLTFNLSLAGPRYEAAEGRTTFVAQLLERLRAEPGVADAGVVSIVPFGGMRGANGVEIEGRARVAGEPPIVVDQRHVSPEYFATMKIPVVGGRGLTAADRMGTEPVAVVNRTMARRYFANREPINARVRTSAGADSGAWFRIVGVVDDVRHVSLSRDAVPEMYRPIAQTATRAFTVVVRTAGSPTAAAPAAQAAVRAVDRDLPLYDVRTMEERIAASFAQTRATMLLLMVTAALAAALAGIAIYGSVWYSVVQRTPEIGIRMALGASRGSIFRHVLAGAAAVAAVGIALGAAAAMAGGTLLQAWLFDTRTTDPLTYTLVALAVLALTIVASIVPAHRAMRVDPLTAIRN
jgi:putative ABC transport system permease protein